MENNNGIFERISNWFEKRVDGEMAELTTNLAEERAKVENLVTERDTLKVENEEQKATILNLTEKVSAIRRSLASGIDFEVFIISIILSILSIAIW